MSLALKKIYTGDTLLYNENMENDIDVFEDYQHQSLVIPSMLEFYSRFDYAGKQGILGLFESHNSDQKYVYKISQYLDFMAQQEYNVMKGLNSIRDYCPHFCKAYGCFKTNVRSTYRKEDNPFNVDKKKDDYVTTDVIIMEHIEDARKLYRYIKNEQISPEIAMSLVKQTLLANIIAGEHIQFTHYDMHSNNVLVKKCSPNTAFLYILDDSRTYLAPTYGYYPMIIDFGFSYNEECANKPFYGTLAHTNVGFMSSHYDQHADHKLFLTSVSYEMKKYKKSDISNKFRSLVKTIYGNCDIDLECGWDTREDEYSISDKLLEKFDKAFDQSEFFKNQGHYIVDLLETLVDLPFEPRHTTDDLHTLATILVKEFSKIEIHFKNDFYNMYILRTMIESTIKNKDLYLNKQQREKAVGSFKRDVLTTIDSLIHFCNPAVNWEKLLCCLLCLSKCIETYCYDKLKKLTSIKKSDYNRLKLKNPYEIYEAIEANIPSHFFFDKESEIYVWDALNKKSYKIKLNETPNLIEILNQSHPFERGTILYEYLCEN